ncbi:MAG TPA: ATP-binding protein, partial [Phototrophicaceae bacterium]|nr:ATP-binding protein [Phototrophicaceae bacterium]
FANADGGELFIGVENDGTVSGLAYSDDKIEILLNTPSTHIHKDTPLAITRAVRVNYQTKTILYFSVPKGTEFVYLTSDGRCLKRKDRESVPVSSEHILLSRAEAKSREYDRAFVENATVADLDLILVNAIAERISKGMSVEKALQHLDLAEFNGSKLILRRAALLLFARNPSKWHPRLQVRILKIEGNEIETGENFNVVSDEQITDNILILIESSWDLLRPHLTETRFSDNAIFETQIRYTELACREALINAIAHRDYSVEGRGIEVRVYTDRLEIINPGSLLSTIRIEDIKALRGVHESRNSYISRVLREGGYMRELGEGMRRIYELMDSNDLTPPDIKSSNNEFGVTLHYKYVYSNDVRLWLENFNELELTRDQKTVIRLGYGGHIISPREIWDAVGIEDTDYYRHILQSLEQIGVLVKTMDRRTAEIEARRKKIARKQIHRYKIVIPQRKGRKQEIGLSDDSDYATIYVVNVPYEANEQDLEVVFSKYG